jgi:hypothetical protein
MNLFRSEEHVRNWSGFKADTEEGIVQLSDMVGLFSANFFNKRLDPDYASHMQEYLMEVIGALKDRGSFWQMPEQ